MECLALTSLQAKLCHDATWNTNGTTLANASIVGQQLRAIFINSKNKLFAIPKQFPIIRMWSESDGWLTATLGSFSVSDYPPLFVTNNDEVYSQSKDQWKIYKWTNSTGTSQLAQQFNLECYRFFIDTNNTLYGSAYHQNQVLSVSLNNVGSTPIVVAGIGSSGGTPDLLSNPDGIFVTSDFHLYVTDSGNGRIQRFRLGENNGTTVAGNGFPQGLILDRPADVTPDIYGYLFIADQKRNRVIQVGPNDYRCVVGCGEKNGLSLHELNAPESIQFDGFGNLYIADTDNSRIQKFAIATNPCGTCKRTLLG